MSSNSTWQKVKLGDLLRIEHGWAFKGDLFSEELTGEWNLLTDAKYVGLENYRTLFNDKRFWDSLQVTVVYVMWNIPLQTALAIFMAVMPERFSTTVSSIMRGIMILPWLMPNVVVALLWLWILDPSIGLMNEFLKAVGIGKQPFMGSSDQAIQSIAGINIWRHVGYTSILVFAGLKTIPKSLYEAAAIDGADDLTQSQNHAAPAAPGIGLCPGDLGNRLVPGL